MNRIWMLLLIVALTAFTACGDDGDNNGTTNNNTSANNTTTGANNTSTGANNTSTGANNTSTGANNTSTACADTEAFDAPLDTCVTCPNATYDCEGIIAAIDFDFDTSTLTLTPADGDASIVSATLGGQRPGDPANPAEDFTVEGTVDGRTVSFDVSAEETVAFVQLNNLVFTDSCGNETDVTFVFNYTPGDASSDAPYCPLGG